LRGVARPELLEEIDRNSRNARASKNESDARQSFFIAPN